MKCSELATHIEELAGFANGLGANTEAADVLCRLLSVSPDRTVAHLVKVIESQPASGGSSMAVTNAKSFAQLASLHLRAVAKAALIKDLKSLASALEKLSGADVDDLIAALVTGSNTKRGSGSKLKSVPIELRESLVQKHYRALESALGDDPGFTAAYRAVETDNEMRVAELVALAKRFAFASVKTRAAALKKVMGRHQALMTSRAKSNATAGRVAG